MHYIAATMGWTSFTHRVFPLSRMCIFIHRVFPKGLARQMEAPSTTLLATDARSHNCILALSKVPTEPSDIGKMPEEVRDAYGMNNQRRYTVQKG